jgi:Rps23 Pro-64 3,4-dihydroxylase Tpa1-like proline 4-hydroxylase
MENDAPWRLRVASFYEQWELHLGQERLPASLRVITSPEMVDRLVHSMLMPIAHGALELSDVTAHKLVPGQTIRIHNDYLEGKETHRLLVQLNRAWTDAHGGFLMLFGSDSPEDIRRAVRPLHCSGLAFTISARSFHAVSTIQDGERYTIVYSFKSRVGA